MVLTFMVCFLKVVFIFYKMEHHHIPRLIQRKPLTKRLRNKWIQNLPNSPDLNVLDYHTWNQTDQLVRKSKNVKTLLDLKREVVCTYMNVDKEQIKKSVLSWEKRLRACVAANGNRFPCTLLIGKLAFMSQNTRYFFVRIFFYRY